MKVITPENDRLYTQNELAERWGVTREYLARMRRDNRGPDHILLHEGGKGLRYKLSAIIEYENERKARGSVPKESYNFGKTKDAEKQD